MLVRPERYTMGAELPYNETKGTDLTIIIKALNIVELDAAIEHE
jgi:hypothetical protein